MARSPLYYYCVYFLSFVALSFGLLETVNIYQPFVKISPATTPINVNNTDNDYFGYSVTAHQLFTNSSGMSLRDILSQTMIMVGAPRGRFPGGLNMTLNLLACDQMYNIQTETLTQEQILGCYQRTGLVYQCPLSTGSCGAALGNGDAEDNDGLLYDRVGDQPIFTYGISTGPSEAQRFRTQDKEGQQMGATLFSTGDTFIACAPMWTFTSSDRASTQPRGFCVYSGRSLRNFTRLYPCTQEGISTNQQREGFCQAGFSVGVSSTDAVATDLSDTYKQFILVSTPGRSFSTGGVFYYNNVTTPNVRIDLSGSTQEFAVPASLGPIDFSSVIYQSVHNVYDQRFSYYGFAIASGFLTNQITKDFLVTSPRYTQFTQIGRVYIVTNLDTLSTIYFDGEQFGEYFGFSVAVADLNGDGWDDFLVGAPVYSEQFKNEIGRVFVYWNNNGTFNKTATIVGTGINGRFGSSITSLGDINNDGYDDVAISAPFEGSGVVYIYHGQSMDNEGSIINTTAQQRIDGADVARQVTNLTSVSSFGYSISGTVDVDQNQYRDLVIGAYESQSVFVLRSRPVAIAQISLNITQDEIALDSYQCIYNNLPINCFSVKVCTQYYGRGLESGFNTTYRLSEVIQDDEAPRLFFTNPSENFVIRDVSYVGINMSYCDNVMIFIQNSTNVANFMLSAELLQIDQDRSVVDTEYMINTNVLSPVIDSSPTVDELGVTRSCGFDGVCQPDLVLTHINTTYINAQDERVNTNNLTLGNIERVQIFFDYSNNATDDAFNTFLNFTIPKLYFQSPQILPLSAFITCIQDNSTQSNDTYGLYICRNIRSPLRNSDGTTRLYLQLTVRRDNLIGNEGNLSVSIGIVTPIETFNMEQDTSNNFFPVQIPVVAQANIALSMQDVSDAYFGNGSSFSTPFVNTLGRLVSISVEFRNNGPSQIRNAILDISIPVNSAETGNNYYLYPFNLRSESLTCDNSSLNPERYSLQPGRRRRSIDFHTSTRHKRQTSTPSVLDCSQPSQIGCVTIRCSINSFTGAAAVIINTYIDERFYQGRETNFVFNAHASIDITDGVTNTGSDPTSVTNIITLRLFTTIAPANNIPWYVIAVPIIGSIIFIAILAVILYCFGFFRRKKHQVDIAGAGGDDFEQFAQNPFGNNPGGGAPPANKEQEAAGTNL